jgi:alpha-beta hydrolase superfamily lysophospholipase
MRSLFLHLLLAISLASPALAEPVCNVDSLLGQELNLPIYEWIDNSVPTKGIVVAVHGMTFYAHSYDNVARYFASKGYPFYAADMRGFGRWTTENVKFNGDDKIHFTDSENDVLKIVQTVRAKNPDTNVLCLGESLGANIALWVVSTHPELVDASILSAPGVKTQIHPRARWVPDLFRGLAHPKSPLNLEPYITPYLAEDKSIAASCLKDPQMKRALSPVELVKAHITNTRCLKQVQQIPVDMPILVLAGKKDQVFKTPALVEFVKQLGTRKVSMHVFPEKGHLLLEHQPLDPQITKIIDGWLDESEAAMAATKSTRLTSSK